MQVTFSGGFVNVQFCKEEGVQSDDQALEAPGFHPDVHACTAAPSFE